jgi:ABC-type nitrate/sulfonate/bicarbonate transport system substrate-binding protein
LLLRQHGLDPQTDVKLVNLEVGDVPAVFRAGNVDAALIWEPGFSQLRDVKGATVLAMDTDTEVYKRFGTMTGPDVLILGRKWVDENPQRAQRFMTAYFEALEWVAAHTNEAAELVQGKYIQQDLELIRNNINKFVWHNAQQQISVMSEQGIYPQAELIIDILYTQMKAIPEKPEFREWVNLEILPIAKDQSHQHN